MSYDIQGLGSVPTDYQYDYTNPAVSAEYKRNMDALIEILNKAGALDQTDVVKMQNAMRALQALALQGNDGGNPNGPRYMTTGMLDSVSVLSKALSDQGITSPDFKATPAQLEAARRSTVPGPDGTPIRLDMYTVQVTTVQTITSNMSLIAMIELDFIPETFKEFAAIIGGLKEQFDLSSDVMESLNVLMNISNMMKSGSVGDFKVIPANNGDIPEECINDLVKYMNEQSKGSGDAFKNQWNADKNKAAQMSAADPTKYPTAADAFKTLTGSSEKLASFLNAENDKDGKRATYVTNNIYSKHFSQVSPTATPTPNAAYELLEARNTLATLLDKLDAQVKASDNPPNSIPPRQRTNTLNYYLNEVIKDIDKSFEGVDRSNTTQMTQAVSNWIMDSQNKGSGDASRGAIGANLNRALDMVKNLNDTQITDLKQEYERFNEFIKLCTMMLETIYKAMSGSAQGIR